MLISQAFRSRFAIGERCAAGSTLHRRPMKRLSFGCPATAARRRSAWSLRLRLL